MTPPRLEKLIGVPYALPSDPPKTFDCFSLVWFVRAFYYGLPTPLPYHIAALKTDDIGRVIIEVMHAEIWQEQHLAQAQHGDVVQLEQNHVGVLIPDGVIHAWHSTGRGSVVCTSLKAAMRLFPIYRCLRLSPQWMGSASNEPTEDYLSLSSYMGLPGATGNLSN